MWLKNPFLLKNVDKPFSIKKTGCACENSAVVMYKGDAETDCSKGKSFNISY